MENKNKRGFTLVELIVVITIIAILGTIAFISLQGYSASARDSRRISDVNNIKTSLELFQINAGEYPLPDGGELVTYGTEVLWTQGVIGDRVTKNLSKNLNKKLVDPLLETEYTYSVSNTKKEFQILALYEKDLTNNIEGITQANASLSLTPRIIGTYNELYLKTSTNIIPMPSIITSEPLPLNFLTNTGAIKSQIMTNGENIPNLSPQITTKTGGLDISFELAPLIIKTSSNEDKLDVINKIQSAYSGTKLANSGIYKYILSRTSNTEKLDLVEKTILSNDGKIQLAITNGECGSDNGQDLANTPTNLCTKGIAGSVTDGGVGNTYTWSCASADLGETVSCSANHVSVVNGECGSDNGVNMYVEPTNLCSNGTAGSVTDGGVGNNYSWNCTGTNGGITASCSAPHLAIVNGVCGSSNGQDLYETPISNLCTTGTASSVIDNGLFNTYTWSCNGTPTYGTNASCSANHTVNCTNITNSIVNYWKFNDLTPSDNFTGTAFNTDRWTINDIRATSTVTNNRYEGVVSSQTQWSRSLINGKSQLVGDFDVQIDAGLISKTDNNLLYGELIISIPNQYIAYVRAVASGGGNYNSDIGHRNGSGWTFDASNNYTYSTLANTGNSVKLRITRVGTVLTTYGRNGSAWVQVAQRSNWGTGQASISLAGPEVVTTFPSASTWIDNFNVINGEKVTDSKSAKNGSLQCVTGLCTWGGGKISNALTFDGVNDKVVLDPTLISTNTSGFTIGGWIYLNSYNATGQTPILVDRTTSYFDSQFLIFPNDGGVNAKKLAFSIYTNSGGYTALSNIIIPLNTWIYVTTVYNGSQIKLYINGIQNGTISSISGTPLSTSSTLMMGADVFGNYMNGKMDDFVIYNRALTDQEILKAYNDGNAGGTVCGY